MRFCSLGSGSTGNATLVEAHGASGTTRLLIDCGFSLKELDARLARAGLSADMLDAVFVTHEHADHVGSALALARRDGVASWMSRGTWHAIGEPAIDAPLHFARDGETIALGELELQPFTVPHDAREPLQLRCEAAGARLGVLTDVGSITPHLLAHLRGCDALLLECNHDPALLAASSYPMSLKLRIGGRHGHLANDVSSRILAECTHDRLRHLVAAHLSQQNNRPDLVRAALAPVWTREAERIVVADAERGFDWITVGA